MKYYDMSNLDKVEAQYKILLGQRANGKSYQVKQKILKQAMLGEKFVYLRRWKEDIKAVAVENYFDDMNIKQITNGEWECIKAWRNEIFFSKKDENGNEIKSECIGRYCALNEAERYKSWAFINYKYIDYEEFITDASYLVEEPKKLQQFVSTVARLNTITVYMIGNTLSRVCPYFNEWCLEGVLLQKQGTIEVYHFHTGEDIINIAVEYCKNAEIKNRMFFGQTAKQIVSGEWDTIDVPKLPQKLDKYETVYEILLIYQSFKFVLDLLIEPNEGGKILYVYPYTRNRKIHRILSDEFSDKPYITNKLDLSKKPEFFISECMRLNKVCYSDNLTGADFKHVNNIMHI